MQKLSVINLPHAEAGLHKVIAAWGMSVPLPIYYWNRGLYFAPMIRVTDWFEHLLVRRPTVLFGGFTRQHPALPHFLKAFWAAYKYEEPTHAVFSTHENNLDSCVPICVYTDEGRGLRKAPVQVVGLETLFGAASFDAFAKVSKKKPWDNDLFWSIQCHTGKGSSLLTRLLLYVLPNKLYKGKRNTIWYEIMGRVATDLASAFNDGVIVNGKRWHLILVGVKGDTPALCKVGRMSRTFQHLQGSKGICFHCLAGQTGLNWEDLTDHALWHNTLYAERPWHARSPNCLAPVPYSSVAPERMFRSDCLHLIKLGVARHFLASSVVVLGEWNVWPGSAASVEKLLDLSYSDFIWSCRNELNQTPHLKGFTKDLLHWPRRASFPWGGFSDHLPSLMYCCVLICTRKSHKMLTSS